MAVSAQTEGENGAEGKTLLTIRVGDKIYENVTGGSVIVGNFNLNDLEFWVEAVNGNVLKNVGSKSTAKDSQGRVFWSFLLSVTVHTHCSARIDYTKIVLSDAQI